MKFKVGDKVAVYEGYQDRKTGVVQKPMYTSKDINTDNPQYFSVLLDKEWGYGCTYHYKQCRKLVNKKTNKTVNFPDWLSYYIDLHNDRFKKLEDKVEKLEKNYQYEVKIWDEPVIYKTICPLCVGSVDKCGCNMTMT